jgi:hypothetical protein
MLKIEHSWHNKPISGQLEKEKSKIKNEFSHLIYDIKIILLIY